MGRSRMLGPYKGRLWDTEEGAASGATVFAGDNLNPSHFVTFYRSTASECLISFLAVKCQTQLLSIQLSIKTYWVCCEYSAIKMGLLLCVRAPCLRVFQDQALVYQEKIRTTSELLSPWDTCLNPFICSVSTFQLEAVGDEHPQREGVEGMKEVIVTEAVTCKICKAAFIFSLCCPMFHQLSSAVGIFH